MSLETRALEIVEDVLGIEDADARRAFIAEQCGDDAPLRARVEALFAHEHTDFRLTRTESFARPLSIVEAIPARIGPYRVTREIARGGMGAVVLAERDDGVFEARVAIKLIRADIASDRARRRFEEERRILARLRHPRIVRILDGGDISGRPWLAMDFVDGQAVTEALLGAPLAARLDGFEAICEAVAFAHRNLVIHADIKPSNVLMDGEGQVHLLDFGIARLVVDLDDAEAGDPYPLTKGYAAPERAVGVAPTIASDVFSLGVLLLGMLGKSVPGEDVPCVPGTRLPQGQLDGDLAAIAATALATDPAARYQDVPALLDDIRRHRRNMPVTARHDAGRTYVAGRFVRRHWRGLALAALTGLGLLGATAISTTLYVRAERARVQADTRFLEMRRLARFMLFDHYDRLADAPGTVPARAQLADRATRYLDELRAVPGAPADLRLETAQGYRRLATILGVSGVSSLGDPGAAHTALDKAEALLASVLADQPRNAAAMEESGWVDANRWTLGADNAASSALRARARQRFMQALDLDSSRSGATLGLLTLEAAHGYELIWTENRPAAAVPVLRSALARLKAVPFPPDLQRQAALLEVNILGRLGDAVYYAGDPRAALVPYREQKALVLAQLAHRPSVVWTDKLGEAAFNLGGTLVDQPGAAPAALAELDPAAEALRRVMDFGPDAAIEKRWLIVQGQRSLTLAKLGKVEEAVAVSAQSIALREARLARSPADAQRNRDFAVALPNHARLLEADGQTASACRSAARAVAVWESIRRRGNLSKRDAAIDLPAAVALKARLCG